MIGTVVVFLPFVFLIDYKKKFQSLPQIRHKEQNFRPAQSRGAVTFSGLSFSRAMYSPQLPSRLTRAILWIPKHLAYCSGQAKDCFISDRLQKRFSVHGDAERYRFIPFSSIISIV